MVSKTTKKSLRRKPAVFAAIHRRLLKIFSKLSSIATANRRKGYKPLKKIPTASPEPEPDIVVQTLASHNRLLPPPISPAKPTILLDLDETLVHSKLDPPPNRFDFVIRPRINGVILNFYVLKRPGVDQLLETLADRFEIVIFTAGLKEYASLVLDHLDKKSVISHVLYRDSCKEIAGKYVKDLSEIGRDLRRVVIVDDNPNAYSLQPENAIPIRSFIDDRADTELWKLMKFFEVCDYYDDLRDAVKCLLSSSE